jgi:hypothetical protein
MMAMGIPTEETLGKDILCVSVGLAGNFLKNFV